MLLQMALLHSFLWLSNILLYIYHSFTHSSVSGHLFCFHILAIKQCKQLFLYIAKYSLDPYLKGNPSPKKVMCRI